MSKSNITKINETETHPLLPSGEWEGFYCYHHDPEQHKMMIDLTFLNSIVTGMGVDDVAPFTWKGKYDLAKFKIDMTKSYSTHSVFYKGDIDENGIWGLWEILHDYSKYPPFMVDAIKEIAKDSIQGGFHIWPKKNSISSTNTAEKEVIESSLKLEELFLESFN